VTCSSCGQPAQVPFVPRNDKPVYCSDCFSKVRAYSGAGSRY
jgi:CxxC-x17-CxxC domain-containing protein